MIQKIDGMEDVINHLSFSPKGKFLVANLGSGGIRVFQNKPVGKGRDPSLPAKSFSLIAEDRDYGSGSYGSEFSPDGKYLATTCYDGMIRMYKVDSKTGLKPIQKISTKSGKQPYSLAFSPDGKELAVGYDDSTGVDVYNISSSLQLTYKYSPNTSGVDNGSLNSVTYSGDFLYAGGMFYKNGIFSIRRWKNRGRGSFIDLPGSPSTIMHILPYRSGIVYGAGDPAMGALNASGKPLFFRGTQIADHRGEDLRISAEGTKVQFQYTFPAGKNLAVYDLNTRSFVSIDSGKNLKPAITESKGIKVENWENHRNPRLGGNPISLQQYERSRSLAIHPDGQSFLLGADWSLRYYNKTGKLLWQNPVPGAAWSVNISGDGKFALAAFGDGTIRWYRLSDGKELLAFFPHADRKRWVLWTPGGYYDASVGGEELIGWHVNRGNNVESDFFPISKFRDSYYRPDVIAKVLEYADVDKALAAAEEELKKEGIPTESSTKSLDISKSSPPVISIKNPRRSFTKSRELTIKYEIRSTSSQRIKKVKVYLDGSLAVAYNIDFAPGGSEKFYNGEVSIGAPAKEETKLSIIAETEDGVPSEADEITIVYEGKEVVEKKKPNLFILSVGVGKYRSGKVRQLQYPPSDAREFYKMMKKQKGVVYKKITPEKRSILLDTKANKDNIIDSIGFIKDHSQPGDVTMVFFSGHGESFGGNSYYFIPHDFNENRKYSTGVSGSVLMDMLAEVKGHVVLFIDACYSGSLSSGSFRITSLINKAKDPNKRFVVYTSSSKYEKSFEGKRNGIFTQALIKAIAKRKGKDRLTNAITTKSLGKFLDDEIRNLSNGKQTPNTSGTTHDFIIAK